MLSRRPNHIWRASVKNVGRALNLYFMRTSQYILVYIQCNIYWLIYRFYIDMCICLYPFSSLLIYFKTFNNRLALGFSYIQMEHPRNVKRGPRKGARMEHASPYSVSQWSITFLAVSRNRLALYRYFVGVARNVLFFFCQENMFLLDT